MMDYLAVDDYHKWTAMHCVCDATGKFRVYKRAFLFKDNTSHFDVISFFHYININHPVCSRIVYRNIR